MKKFFTGHEVFDEISDIRIGNSILVLDGGYGEASYFLERLLKSKDYIIMRHKIEEEVVGKQVTIQFSTLNDLSIKVNNIRRGNEKKILIHDYLSDLLIKFDPDLVLKLLAVWKEETQRNETVEFYILTKDAFAIIEKKLLSLLDGGIEVEVTPQKEIKQSSFTLIKCCKPEYSLKPIKFIISNDELLIEWMGEFTNRIPAITSETLKEKIRFYEENINNLKIIKGEKDYVNVLSEDFWILSQIDGVHLLMVKMLYPDIFESLLEKIATWEISGYVKLIIDKGDEPLLKNAKKLMNKKGISLKTKFALGLPSRFFYAIQRISSLPKVPAKVYVMEKRSIFEFLRHITAGSKEEHTVLFENLLKLEEKFHEFVSRKKALEDIIAQKENPLYSLEPKYIPKIIKLTIYYGYGLNVDVKFLDDRTIRMTVPECYICKDISSSLPVCTAITGAIKGVLSVTFKRPVDGREIKCKAIGDNACEFEFYFLNP
ncbi:MAG: 4-vinyl reductase [Nitrososphaerota archaeon]|nr:4-vinyl reductase [Aigarchaeota archaeon]MDW8076137.1 4-vinyl reductase [Nitrososphaerota archaeon]